MLLQNGRQAARLRAKLREEVLRTTRRPGARNSATDENRAAPEMMQICDRRGGARGAVIRATNLDSKCAIDSRGDLGSSRALSAARLAVPDVDSPARRIFAK